MRYFFDTEFNENGKTIELISIGIVAEDGREYYACNNELDLADCNPWVRENVFLHLPAFNMVKLDRHDNPTPLWKNRSLIAEDIKNFVMQREELKTIIVSSPHFYAYFADYDWIVMCQLYGRMINLPNGFPFYCRDIKQLMYHLGVEKDDLPKQTGAEHDALEDARWNRDVFNYLKDVAKKFPDLNL